MVTLQTGKQSKWLGHEDMRKGQGKIEVVVVSVHEFGGGASEEACKGRCVFGCLVQMSSTISRIDDFSFENIAYILKHSICTD